MHYSFLSFRLKRFARRKYKNEAAYYAAYYGDLRHIETFLNNGGDVDATDIGNDTLLMAAVLGQQNAMVKLLLDEGASIDLKGHFGTNPLLRAALSTRDVFIVKFLVDAGANVNAQNDAGHTALIIASAIGPEKGIVRSNEVRNQIIRVLLDAGANPNIADKSGKTPFAHAIDRNDVEIVDTFLHAGVNLETRSPRGTTPLLHAVRYSSPEIVEKLVKAGADTSVVNTKREGCLDLVRNLNRQDLAYLFSSPPLV